MQVILLYKSHIVYGTRGMKLLFIITSYNYKYNKVGPTVVLSYVVSGVSALLSVFCYTEFAVKIPVAGNTNEFNSRHIFNGQN